MAKGCDEQVIYRTRNILISPAKDASFKQHLIQIYIVSLFIKWPKYKSQLWNFRFMKHASIFSWRIFCLGAIVNNRLHYLVETIQSSNQSWAWNVFTVAVKERHSIQLTVSYYVNNNQSKRKPKPLSRLEAISWWAELSEVHFKRCSRVPLIFATKATRMESVRARAALVRLGSSQISKRLTLVAVANDGFILSCTRRPSLVREKEEKKNRIRQSIT